MIIKQWPLFEQDPSIGVRIFLECLFGMSELHNKRFVHRDFKPENMLVEEEKGKLRVKIADFGAARLCMKGMTSYIGTSLYMAP